MIGRGWPEVRALIQIILGEEGLASGIALLTHLSAENYCVVPRVIQEMKANLSFVQVDIFSTKICHIKLVDNLHLLFSWNGATESLDFEHEALVSE